MGNGTLSTSQGNSDTKYQSVEQKIIDSNIVKNFVPTVYGGFAFMFRIPTTIRKIKKDQHLSCLINTNESSSSLAARTTGGIAGLCTAGYVCFQAITEATKGNYLPLAVIGVANALSFAYELGRKELFGGK